MTLIWIIPAVVVVLGLLVWLFMLQTNSTRRKFVQKRSPVSDDLFLQKTDATPQTMNMYINVREAFAKVYKIPREYIYSDDTLKDLDRLTFDGIDFLGLAYELETGTGIKIPRPLFEDMFNGRFENSDDLFQAEIALIIESISQGLEKLDSR